MAAGDRLCVNCRNNIPQYATVCMYCRCNPFEQLSETRRKEEERRQREERNRENEWRRSQPGYGDYDSTSYPPDIKGCVFTLAGILLGIIVWALLPFWLFCVLCVGLYFFYFND
jgi:hypothetical protein